jgi:hypothetical protein
MRMEEEEEEEERKKTGKQIQTFLCRCISV